MTLRGCLFGDSHIAALKTAWSRSPSRWPGLGMEFIGAHGHGIGDLEIRDDAARPRSRKLAENLTVLNGRSEFPLAGYDFFAITGGRMSVFRTVSHYRRFGWLDLPSLAHVTDPDDLDRELISTPTLMAALVDSYRATIGFQLAARLTRATGKPVYLLEQPRPSADCLKTRDGSFAGFNRALADGDAEALNRVTVAAFLRAAEGIATALPQPRETIRDGLFTLSGLSSGSIRLTRRREVQHGAQDFLHANPDYGGIVLDQLAAAAAG
jgi:hypothetical protein